ncbi:MAG: 50S ribosomal protein L4 [Proteobacteria bacterium]|nr:50S ribosomal protein L4 [Pseudomonadota bacterium]
MEVQVKNILGQPIKKISINPEIFGVEMNEHVLHTVVKAYRANMRQGTHATKTKAMVAGGGKKPFKQKGTGEARQGSSRSPLNPGGGVSHGPQPRDYNEKINKATKQLALAVALSDKARHGKLTVLDDLKISKFSTKHICEVLKTLTTPKALILDERKDDLLYRSARNIYGVNSHSASDVNASDVLRYENFIITETALNALQSRFKGGK